MRSSCWLALGLGGAFAQLDLSSEEGWAQTSVGRFFVARAAAETCTSTALLTLNASTVVCQSWPPTGVDPLHAGGLAECLAATPGAFAREVNGATLCCARGQHFRLDTGDPATAAAASSRFVASEVHGPEAGPFDQIGVRPLLGRPRAKTLTAPVALRASK